jgi:hypothetical protein
MAINESFFWLLWFMVSSLANLADTALINKRVLPKQEILPKSQISLSVEVDRKIYDLVSINPCQCNTGNHWSIKNKFAKTLVCVVNSSQNEEILRETIPSRTNAHINLNSNEKLNIEFYSVAE